VQEANEGNHTQKVRFNLLHGFMLFIVSEIMLFFAIFWAFFHSSLAPTVSIYCMWPPIGIEPIYPWGLPFFNTVLLVSSGVTLTVSHRAILSKFFDLTSQALIVTLILGISFTTVQGFEYVQAPFSINDGVFGSVFFFSTGFHGLHVFIGSIMLSVSLLRNGLRQLLATQHIGFTASIWYWHFVDVVWIFLFLMVYWWGS
jgi:cytochrome c oxidase subunit 3